MQSPPSDRRPPPRQKASPTGRPSARFPTVPGELCADCLRSRLRRLGFASPLGRDPSRTRSDYHDVESQPEKAELLILHKTGTSHFALTPFDSALTTGGKMTKHGTHENSIYDGCLVCRDAGLR